MHVSSLCLISDWYLTKVGGVVTLPSGSSQELPICFVAQSLPWQLLSVASPAGKGWLAESRVHASAGRSAWLPAVCHASWCGQRQSQTEPGLRCQPVQQVPSTYQAWKPRHRLDPTGRWCISHKISRREISKVNTCVTRGCAQRRYLHWSNTCDLRLQCCSGCLLIWGRWEGYLTACSAALTLMWSLNL